MQKYHSVSIIVSTKGKKTMKYQIYLNKTTSDKINLIAQLLDQTPARTIKNLLEKSLGEMLPPSLDVDLKELTNGHK